jgi:hypothetical protein
MGTELSLGLRAFGRMAGSVLIKSATLKPHGSEPAGAWISGHVGFDLE